MTFRVQALLGAALLGQGRYADAESLLVKAYQGMTRLERRPKPIHGEETKDGLTEVLELLVRLYDAWGKKDLADEWRVKLEATGRM